MANAPYTTARKITPGALVDPGRGLIISCTGEGKIGLIMQDGSALEIYAYVGTSQLDGISVVSVNAAATTATATVSVVA